MKIRPSKYAQPLFTESFYEADVHGGRGRGGSHGITQHALFEMVTSNYFRGFFVRAVLGSVRDSLWQDFKDRIEEVSDLNNYDYSKHFAMNENEMKAVYLPNGNQIKSKGFKASSKGNTANMKSLAGATHVYIEECEEVGEEEYNKLADSLRTIKSPVQIIRSWNPPPLNHWLIKQYYDTVPSKHDGFYELEPKGVENHISMFGTYLDNIKNLDSNTVARYERYKETNPRYYYNQILGLVNDGGHNKVYYGWKRVSFEEFQEMDGYLAYGLDFGDTAPTSLIAVKYKDGCFYRHQILYKSMRALNVEYRDEIENIKGGIESVQDNEQNNIWTKHKGVLTYVFNLLKVDKNRPMFCDPAQKGLIMELRESGYMAVRAQKDKAANINFINRALNYFTEDSYDLEKEYNEYYLEVDVNKVPIDGKPKKGNDHALEAAEYACRGIKDELGITL